jgi:hypothetical protein
MRLNVDYSQGICLRARTTKVYPLLFINEKRIVRI